MLGVIAQFETEILAERRMDGIYNAKARGINLGWKKGSTEQQCLELQRKRKQGTLIETLMKDSNLSTASMYQYTDRAEVVKAAS